MEITSELWGQNTLRQIFFFFNFLEIFLNWCLWFPISRDRKMVSWSVWHSKVTFSENSTEPKDHLRLTPKMFSTLNLQISGILSLLLISHCAINHSTEVIWQHRLIKILQIQTMLWTRTRHKVWKCDKKTFYIFSLLFLFIPIDRHELK